MRYYVSIAFVIFTVLSTFSAFGQSKYPPVMSYSFWQKTNTSKTEGFKLPQLITSESDWHWRLYLPDGAVSYAIQVFKTADSMYSASVDFYTEEYLDDPEEKPTYRVFGETVNLEPEIAAEIYKLVTTRHINNISGNEIKEWSAGLDGNSYVIECAIGKNYSRNTYWSPDAKKNIKEAAIINDFIKDALNIIDMKHLESFFSMHIPFESFHNYGSAIGSKVLTKRGKKKYKLERDTYRRQNHLN